MVLHYFGKCIDDIDKYQDDIFAHSKNIAAHLHANGIVYERARLAGLCFSLKKSHFNYHRIRCLGHIITKAGRTPDPAKIQAIVNLAEPTTPEQIRHFLGLVAFNWDYIEHVATLTQPLRDLIKTPT